MPAGSLIPVRCFKGSAVKSDAPKKSSSQLTVPSGLRGNVTSKNSESVTAKTNSVPAIEKPNKNFKNEVNKAKKEPLKLNKKVTKPVPVLQRKLSSVNVQAKEQKSHVKESQAQREPLKTRNRPVKSVEAPVLQRNVSSVNVCNKEPKPYNINKSKSQVQPVPHKISKSQEVKSQNKSNPVKKTQTIGERRIRNEQKQSTQDEKQFKSKAEGFHGAVDRKVSNAHNFPSSIMSNKENVNTIIVEEVKQITEKRKHKLNKENSHKIQSVSQKSHINEDLEFSEDSDLVLTESNGKENESKLSCPKIVVSDSEFQNSKFFKSLILSESGQSPVVTKFCPGSRDSSIDAISKSPMKKFLPNYSTQDEFLEDLRRNSAHFRKKQGVSPAVPGMKSTGKRYLESFASVNDFVENLRRNSAINLVRRATLQGSPHLIGNQPSVRDILNRNSSAKDIVEELRRNSANFWKRKGQLLVTPSPFQNTPYARRWTCNVQNSSVKRLPLLKEDSRFQVQKKIDSSVCKNLFDLQSSSVKGIETSKKKDKSKKKVTFYLSPTNSSESTSFSEKLESDDIKIPEQSSQNSTPEFELNLYRNKEDSVVLEHCMKPRNSSTPEFNFEALKILPSSFPNESKSGEKEEIQSTFTPKFDNGNMECYEDKKLYAPKCEEAMSSSFQPIITSSSCKSLTNNFKSILNPNQKFLNNEVTDFKNIFEENTNNVYSFPKSFAREGQTAIVRPMKQLSISSNNDINETEAFIVQSEAATPYSFSAYSNSYLVNTLSPPVLIDRPSILASYAPICTPLVLKNVSQNSVLSPVRQKLDFEEVKLERRESQICLQDVPTLQKMYDYLCDQECCMLSLLSSETLAFDRNISNPIADILSNGDEMHFVPLNLHET